MKIKLEDTTTSAQAVTKICYNEPTRNLNYRIECEDLQDLKKCVEIIKYYNDFDYKSINRALDRYFTPEDKFTFIIARENSPAMYIRLGTFGGEEVKDQLPDLMERFARDTKADEANIDDERIWHTIRFWWD